jgi:peptidoglycan hydrolase-like protein with peptidoglycan-binding domain
MAFTDTLAKRKRLQLALIAAGYDVGPDGADGDLGTNTASAIRAFRRANMLTDVAVIDGKLLTLLNLKETPMDTVLANVKSAWLSKLNWTLAAGALFNLFAFFGLQIPSDVKDAVVMIGNGLVIVVAFVIKTWFTTSITPASAKKL